MKKIIFFIIFLVINIKANSQEMSSQTNTTLSTNESVSTENNITKINLFNIDYNGTKIPINIIYSHNGLKVSDTPNSIGYGWYIQDLGFIRSIINNRNDTSPNNGWFNSPFPNFSYSFYEDSCESCPNFDESLENDLSPDYFSLNLTNGIQFDFLYKKTVSGTTVSSLTPVILSNSDNYKINTNFNNFYTTAGQQTTTNIVFDIKDKFGNKYEFINGPIKQDSYRSPNSDFNNDYYLSFITNTINKDSLFIEYNTYEEEVKKSYAVGFNRYIYSGNNVTNNDDYQNNIIRGVTGDYFFIDKTRFNYKKIRSKKSTIEFVYNQDYFKLLDEIKIYDNNNNYVSGYKFEYDQSHFLRKISKYNNVKTESIIIYEFDYYQGQEFFNDLGVMEDYFGFYNGVYNSNPLPFPIRNANGTITPSGNLSPNLSNAKENMLYKIKNIYSGETEFDYSLNFENHSYFGNIYGGGLVIKSKKDSPIIGKAKYTQYDYQNLSGFVIFTDSPGHHYIYQGQDKKYTSLNFTLDEANNGYLNEATLNSKHKNGNYFKDITEFVYDYDSMLLEYKIVKTYVPNYEGLFRSPLLKKETHYDNSNSKIKEIELEYDYTTSETITRADFRIEKRRVGQVTYWNSIKNNSPFYVNKIKLINQKETLFSNINIEKNTQIQYVGTNDSRIRSQSFTNSLGDNIYTKHYYPDDIQASSFPYVNDMINKNIIGKPLIVESFEGNEKLNTTVEYFKNWGNNIISNEIIKFSKGSHSLETSIKTNLIDLTNGNILEKEVESGIKTSYIWGYNKNLIVAKIENISYNSIPSNLITAIENESNNGTETSLLNALNNLRNNSVLSGTMITTYTHIPSVGISTLTDPKGNLVSYFYDSFNRIKYVKDKDNNIINEKKYHYKTQN